MRALSVGRFLVVLLLLLLAPAVGSGGTFDRLLPEIRRHTPGKLYDVDGPYRGEDGLMRYRIKWMTPEGRIIWFEVDARNGHILGMVTGPKPSGDIWRHRDEAGSYPPPPPPRDRGPRRDKRNPRRGDNRD